MKSHALAPRVCNAALMVALLWGMLATCGARAIAQTQVPAPAPTSQGEKTVPKVVAVEPTAEDAAIAGRIQRILQSTGWFKNPHVSVRDGVVFIDGKTETQEHRHWASALGQNTEGSVAVVNRIEVETDVESIFGRAGEEFVKMYRKVVQGWPWALLAVVISVATWLLARLVTMLGRRFLVTRIPSSLLLNVIVQALSIPVFLLGIYFVLQLAGLTRLALTVLGGTGLIGIIVGFAFRDIAENFLAKI